MKTITIRNMPPAVEKMVRERAEGRGVSANQAILSLLLERAGIASSSSSSQYTDLDDLIGSWSRKEGLEFEKRLLDHRQVDDELWK